MSRYLVILLATLIPLQAGLGVAGACQPAVYFAAEMEDAGLELPCRPGAHPHQVEVLPTAQDSGVGNAPEPRHDPSVPHETGWHCPFCAVPSQPPAPLREMAPPRVFAGAYAFTLLAHAGETPDRPPRRSLLR